MSNSRNDINNHLNGNTSGGLINKNDHVKDLFDFTEEDDSEEDTSFNGKSISGLASFGHSWDDSINSLSLDEPILDEPASAPAAIGGNYYFWLFG